MRERRVGRVVLMAVVASSLVGCREDLEKPMVEDTGGSRPAATGGARPPVGATGGSAGAASTGGSPVNSPTDGGTTGGATSAADASSSGGSSSTGGTGGSADAAAPGSDARGGAPDGPPAGAPDGGGVAICWPDPNVIMICHQLENACENCPPGGAPPGNKTAVACFALVKMAYAGMATDADCAKFAVDNKCKVDSGGNVCGSLNCYAPGCSNKERCLNRQQWGDSTMCRPFVATCGPCK